MRLVLDLGTAQIEFTSHGSSGAYPWLLWVGALRIAARAGTPKGLTVGETPNLEVALSNVGKRAARIVDVPLRRRATLYDDDGALYFDGTVAQVRVGTELVLTIEA